MTTNTQDFKLASTGYFCEDCLAKDPDVYKDKTTLDYSEAKEEETECYYCKNSGITRNAEVLLQGYPACRECRRRKNIVNFVARDESNQKVIVTQITVDKNLTQSASQGVHHKHSDSSPFMKQSGLDPRMGPQERTIFRNPKVTMQRSQNPHMSMALPSGMGIGSLYGNGLRQSSTMISHKAHVPYGKIVNLDHTAGMGQMDYTRMSPEARNQFVGEFSDIGISQMPKTTRHDKAPQMSMGSFDLMKVIKSSQSQIQKPSPMMSDPKVSEFFKKMNENGIQSLKGQLLFSSSVDGFSGRKFHQKIDKKSPIIVLVILENGFIIGGFTYKGIDPKSVEVSDNLAGLICTYDSKKIDFYQINNNKIIYAPNGVTFGSPISLALNLETLSSFVCNLEIGYYDPSGNKVLFSSGENKDLGKLIKEVAVYQLK